MELNPHEDNEWNQPIYDVLHQLAKAALLHESPGHSLQTTLIANDAYLRLMQQRNFDPSDPAQGRVIGASIIRRLLVDYSRVRKAKKRGGTSVSKIPLQFEVADVANSSCCDIEELARALEDLEQQHPRSAQVVEMRFFGGLAIDEIAETLGVSPRTVSYDWRFAKAWLYNALEEELDGDEKT